MVIFRQGPSNGITCRYGRQKSWFWANIWLHRVLSMLGVASTIYSAVTDHGELMTLVACNIVKTIKLPKSLTCMFYGISTAKINMLRRKKKAISTITILVSSHNNKQTMILRKYRHIKCNQSRNKILKKIQQCYALTCYTVINWLIFVTNNLFTSNLSLVLQLSKAVHKE